MKQTITTTFCILLFTLCINTSFSQNNFRWADSGAVWHYNNRTPIFTFGYKRAWLEKDTIINTIECQKIKSEKQYCYQSGPTTYVSSTISVDSTYYVYKNGIDVFIFRNGIFKLWYKTQSAVNDIWHFGNSSLGVKVDSIHSFNYNNQTLHDYYLSLCDSLGNTIVNLVYEPTIYGPDTVELRATGIVNDLFGPYYGFEGLVNFPPNPEFGDIPNYLKCYSSNNFPQWISYGNDCYNNVITDVETIEVEENNISLYPNPTNNSITFSNNEAFNNNNPLQITITDDLGNNVFQNQFKGNIPTISLETFSSGIYFVKLYQQGKAPINKKVIKY